jgi:hypothetical protein
MTRKQTALAGLVLLAALCAGRAGWRTAHPPPVETAHAAALATLPAGVPITAPTPWLTDFFPAPTATPSCEGCHEVERAAWARSAHARATPAVDCVTCHERAGVVHGPGATASTATAAAPTHVSSEVHEEFGAVSFCAACHDDARAVQLADGKPRAETTAEWSHTPAARRGETCQTCHMPGGFHTWAGARDPALVQSAFTARAKFISNGDLMVGKLAVTATDAVGHRLPTGATAELALVVDQLDAAGLIIEGTHREGIVGRRLDGAEPTETFDTRLLPGESHELRYEATLHEDCRTLRARVEVRPEAATERRLTAAPDSSASATRTALEAARATRFTA